jgi:hypothetical protein
MLVDIESSGDSSEDESTEKDDTEDETAESAETELGKHPISDSLLNFKLTITLERLSKDWNSPIYFLQNYPFNRVHQGAPCPCL